MDCEANWREKAACRGQTIVLFYGFGETEQQNDRLEREAKAKGFCLSCSVREKCLNEALKNREEGVWGGTSKYERKKMLRSNKQVKPKETNFFLTKIARVKKKPSSESIIESRLAWDGETVLIKREDFVGNEFGMNWLIEKNGKILYETANETDAWLMFGSWTVTF